MYVYTHIHTLNTCNLLYVNCTSRKPGFFLSLVLHRNTVDFYILTLYPATLLNSLVQIMLLIVTVIVAGVINMDRIIKDDI